MAIETEGSFEPIQADVVLAVGSLNWYRETLNKISKIDEGQRPLAAIWHIEPLPPSRASNIPRPWLSLRELVKIGLRDERITDVYSNSWRIRREFQRGTVGLIIVSTLGRKEYLEEIGIPSEWVPMGSVPHEGKDLGLERDIDVLFLGTMDVPRRRTLVAQIRAAGVHVEAVGDWGDPAYWGDRRIELLNRTKILLNLGRTAGELSGLRFVLGMINKAMVVSEPVYHPAPFLPGEHFVMAPLDGIPGLLKKYLKDAASRTKIAEAAYSFVTREHTMENAARRMLYLFEEKVHTCA